MTHETATRIPAKDLWRGWLRQNSGYCARSIGLFSMCPALVRKLRLSTSVEATSAANRNLLARVGRFHRRTLRQSARLRRRAPPTRVSAANASAAAGRPDTGQGRSRSE